MNLTDTETRPSNDLPIEDPDTSMAVDSCQEAVVELNTRLANRTGQRALMSRPAVIPDVSELLKEPPPPEFPLEDDEQGFIDLVR
jgi:hypothetical protein